MTAKRKRGRPPLVEGEETRALYVRLPASGLAAVESAARVCDETPAEYARRVLLARAKRDAKRTAGG